MASEIIVVQTTLDSAESAEALGRSLVREKLAGCVQIDGPITSFYRWKGQVECSTEWRLSVKTAERLFEKVERFVSQHHSYDVPQLVAVRLEHVSGPYSAWLFEQLD